jgi:hypothetical protein
MRHPIVTRDAVRRSLSTRPRAWIVAWLVATASALSLSACCPTLCPKPDCPECPTPHPCPCVDCTTVCCYLEATNGAQEGGCFEYTGPKMLADQFLKDCAHKTSPQGYVLAHPSELPCDRGPVTGMPCDPGVTANGIPVPADTRCCAPPGP